MDRMQFGGFYEHQLPRPWADGAEHRLFQNALDQVELPDRVGYDYIWATEHHFLEEYAHSSSPEVFLAACSQRTKNARIGHGIIQMPPNINHPARVAERVATLDLISDGRCRFRHRRGRHGDRTRRLPRPAGRKEADDARRQREQVVEMFVQQPFGGYQGKYFKMPARNVMPKPMQKPHPPLWMACSNRTSILQAARLGVGALTFSFVGPDQAKAVRRSYYETLEKECVPLGYRVNPQIAIACPFLCLKDGEARAAGRRRKLRVLHLRPRATTASSASMSPAAATSGTSSTRLRKNSPCRRAALRIASATPSASANSCARSKAVGIDQVICLSQAGNIPHEMLCESIELFGKEVLPEFKDRDQKRAGEKGEAGRAPKRTMLASAASGREARTDADQGGRPPLNL